MKIELVNPVTACVSTATLRGAVVDWYIKAGDIKLISNNQTCAIKNSRK